MLHCEDCDYFHSMVKEPEGSFSGSICRFTDHVFFGGVHETVEYPCREVSYSAYLDRLEAKRKVHTLSGENWRLLYTSRHPVRQKERIRTAG